jgi:ribosome-associated toxin RatA of RatAB toxin-antitoxin module
VAQLEVDQAARGRMLKPITAERLPHDSNRETGRKSESTWHVGLVGVRCRWNSDVTRHRQCMFLGPSIQDQYLHALFNVLEKHCGISDTCDMNTKVRLKNDCDEEQAH